MSPFLPSSVIVRPTPPVAALTTIFTPPASCFDTLYVEYYTHFEQIGTGLENSPVHLTLGLLSKSECFPTAYSEQYFYSNTGYYSPAVCPSGYTSACNVNPNATIDSYYGPPLIASETAYRCCPYGYQCSLAPEVWDVCWSVLSTTTTAIFYDDVSGTGPVQTITSPALVSAWAIQVRHRNADLSALPPSITSGEVLITSISLATTLSSDGSTAGPTGKSAYLGSAIETPQVLSDTAKIAISVAIPMGVGIAIICIAIFFRSRHQKRRRALSSSGEEVFPKKLSRMGTLDWSIAIGAPVLAVFSALVIANGTCSDPHQLSARHPLCVGGHLSVQVWLAITGVEFSILGTLILPRVSALITSKIFTEMATNHGARLATLINSSVNAPILTQLRYGHRRVFVMRMFSMVVVAAISILYKFSFTRVDMQTAVAIQGSSFFDYGYRTNGYSPFTNGLIDAVSGSSGSTAVFDNGHGDLESQTLLIGPSLNTSSVTQLLNGTAKACYPTAYIRNTITSTNLIGEGILVSSHPYNDGVRIASPDNTSIVDIYTDNRTMVALVGPNTVDDEYVVVYNVNQQACTGYVTWNNSYGYQDYAIEDPRDISCTKQPFDVGDWREYSGLFATNIIQAVMSNGPNNYSDYSQLWTVTATIILSSTDIDTAGGNTWPVADLSSDAQFQSIKDEYWPDQDHNFVHAECAHFYDSPSFKLRDTGIAIDGDEQQIPANDSNYWNGQVVGIGLIQDAGTGLTSLGFALQGLVLLTSLLSLILLLLSTLPLLTEWPGQWLGLVSMLDAEGLLKSLRGTSAGSGRARGDVKVWLTSFEEQMVRMDDGKRGKRGETRCLRLVEREGKILVGKPHL